MAADLDMAGVELPLPVGTFTGTLDGKGHSIRNLTAPQANGRVGFIDQLPRGTVRNLQLIDVRVHGAGPRIGALAARAGSPTISGCRVTGQIIADDGAQYVGGLVGEATTVTFSRCAAEIDMSVGSQCQYVGGLTGYAYKGTIRDCYARGTIEGMNSCKYVGGLVGAAAYDPQIERCYAAVGITLADGTSGGAKGNDLGAYCWSTSPFWDKELSPGSVGCGGYSTATMQAASLYLDAGWDFAFETNNGTADLWVIPVGGGYPELTWIVGIPAQTPLPGSGTPQDPYQIASVEDLLAIQRLDPAACYLLCEDLDLRGHALTAAPVPPFYGWFIGNGHTISNLHIAGDRALGLFARIGPGATVSDLWLEGVHITGAGRGCYIGALAGRSDGWVINCGAGGVIASGDDSTYVGGLLGDSIGPLIDCTVDVKVTVGHRCRYIGGLVGENDGPVRGCQAFIDLQAGDDVTFLGGLVGNNRGDLYLCESVGRVSAGYKAASLGGLVGSSVMSYDIIDCRTNTSFVGLADCNNVGGVAGDFLGRISRCYARGGITLGDNGAHVGGLVGRPRPGAAVLGSFWCVEGAMTNTANGQKITPADLRDPKRFLDAGWDFVGEQANGTVDLWIMPKDSDDPRLAVLTPGYRKPSLPGQGTPDDPYLIATPQDLGAVSHQDPFASFRLTANMDLSAIRWSESPFWVLFGSFDGGGFTITGLRIPQAARPGLFRWVHADAEVKALTIRNANVVGGGAILACLNAGRLTDCHVSGQVSGTGSVGGIAGYSAHNGVILRCSSAARVMGGYGYLGGLVGDNSGQVEQCFATGDVSGEGAAGGLVGRHANSDRLVQDCYARGNVNVRGYGGGLVGLITKTVKNCYATGAVSGEDELGGLVGVDDLRQTSTSFWDTQTSGIKTGSSGTGLTTVAMQKVQTYKQAGWDFTSTWTICEGKDYPRLQWEGVECGQ